MKSRLTSVSFMFPRTTPEEHSVYAGLTELLMDVPGSTHGRSKVVLRSSVVPDALPITSIQQSDVGYPQVLIEGVEAFDIVVGQFHLADAPTVIQASIASAGAPGVHPHPLALNEIVRQLRGNVVGVDHAGVNLPAASVRQQQWDDLITNLAARSNMYRYPTGEPWPFVIPATEAEYEDDIRHFVPGRPPKFELVYDAYLPMDTIVLQFDLATTLSRAELERRFPAPYGLGLPGLEEYFRSVYAQHPWSNLAIRLDVNYAPTGDKDEEGFDAWLVREGGRIR
jgi:hypothetical protein